jgi:nitroimidazol reductase NimA-like FMN-containing flavoprotein (pyridoxamine 5'-phosphate oxidase superfamily)
VYLHGAVASRLLQHLRDEHPVCITATLVDGIVFARSVFNHSMNYRSAVVFGKGRLVSDADEKYRALTAITEHIAKGRWDEARLPTK